VPGSGPGVQSFYHWAARDLAAHGYVAVTIDPQGVGRSETFGRDGCDPAGGIAACPGVPFQQAGNYVDALQSGIDYVLSSRNPWRAAVDANEVGIAGHSLAARAASYLQGVDRRVKAVVAWDNLASDLQGDSGSASGGGAAGALIGGELPGQGTPVRPRVPALGQANDNPGSTQPANRDPDLKKPGFALWRKSGQPSMELAFAGAGHLDWAQTHTTSAAKKVLFKRFAYYTRAWFDRWLRHDRSATARLLARKVDGVDLPTLLSSKFRSAAFLDGRDCADLAKACG
jgi:hypothetical protein